MDEMYATITSLNDVIGITTRRDKQHSNQDH